jgi:hypothetical protein
VAWKGESFPQCQSPLLCPCNRPRSPRRISASPKTTELGSRRLSLTPGVLGRVLGGGWIALCGWAGGQLARVEMAESQNVADLVPVSPSLLPLDCRDRVGVWGCAQGETSSGPVPLCAILPKGRPVSAPPPFPTLAPTPPPPCGWDASLGCHPPHLDAHPPSLLRSHQSLTAYCSSVLACPRPSLLARQLVGRPS